jgi:hypothetical protein
MKKNNLNYKHKYKHKLLLELSEISKQMSKEIDYTEKSVDKVEEKKENKLYFSSEKVRAIEKLARLIKKCNLFTSQYEEFKQKIGDVNKLHRILENCSYNYINVDYYYNALVQMFNDELNDNTEKEILIIHRYCNSYGYNLQNYITLFKMFKNHEDCKKIIVSCYNSGLDFNNFVNLLELNY